MGSGHGTCRGGNGGRGTRRVCPDQQTSPVHACWPAEWNARATTVARAFDSVHQHVHGCISGHSEGMPRFGADLPVSACWSSECPSDFCRSGTPIKNQHVYRRRQPVRGSGIVGGGQCEAVAVSAAGLALSSGLDLIRYCWQWFGAKKNKVLY